MLLKAKTLSILEGKGIAFQSPHSPLSNLFPCNLTYRGECFLSSEGAYQYARARVNGYDKEAEEIKAERRPYRILQKAREIKATQEWEDLAESVIHEIVLEKFKTIRYCKQFLLGTGSAKLFEGTGDKRWGCGIPLA